MSEARTSSRSSRLTKAATTASIVATLPAVPSSARVIPHASRASRSSSSVVISSTLRRKPRTLVWSQYTESRSQICTSKASSASELSPRPAATAMAWSTASRISSTRDAGKGSTSPRICRFFAESSSNRLRAAASPLSFESGALLKASAHAASIASHTCTPRATSSGLMSTLATRSCASRSLCRTLVRAFESSVISITVSRSTSPTSPGYNIGEEEDCGA
mmetsp:Transcript_59113/g.157035  ORF Transcript_59113/g.157035 Transcript_59113/m.157035 type:complete len:220 (+) Transcript_59113:2349-3008(+)